MLFELIAPIVSNVLLTLLTAVLTAVGSYVAMWVKSRLNASQLELLDQIAANVVLAVEQSNYGKDLVTEAADKKAQAIELMNSFLKKYSITLTEAQIDAAIEAAVANVINANKLIEPPKLVEVEGPQPGGFIDG